ncbi:MAG TPA: lytic transglycosylase domain-containing protein [Longimicrobiales bacterium]|nr:lytic transglycosylase domain-containing protein [Longimicrobiales bacterium]
MQLAIGGALIVPAAGMMASTELERLEAERRSATLQVAHATEAAAAVELAEAEWAAQAATYAAEFGIGVELAEEIQAAAAAENIEPRVAFGLVRAESSFRAMVVSPVGAVGLTQLLPSTARWLVPGTTRSDLMQPETNLRVGFKYLRHLIDQYEGDEKLALTAYNRGPGTVAKLLRRGADPDNGYAEKVLTGSSRRHVALMNAKFGGKARRRS